MFHLLLIHKILLVRWLHYFSDENHCLYFKPMVGSAQVVSLIGNICPKIEIFSLILTPLPIKFDKYAIDSLR